MTTPATDRVEVLHQSKYLRLVKRGRWEFVERTKTSGIVMIVPITAKREVILIEQTRVAVGGKVIEFPAGLAGDSDVFEGEGLIDAARRELLEETGYTARKFIHMTEGPPTAGLSAEIITVFVATGIKKTGPGGGDGHEDIVVHLVPLRGIHRWLANKRKQGSIIDLKIWGGLHFAQRALKQK